MIVQIYAYTNIPQALEAVEAGVDHIGFVAGDYGMVHAELDFDSASDLAQAIPKPAKAVALTMAVEPGEILCMCRHVEPDIVHISSDLMDLDPAALSALRRELPPHVGLMKAIPVTDDGSVERALAFAPSCDFLLLDSKVPAMPGVGATGRTHDWSISRRIVERVRVPVVLAGGLTAQNVAQAIRQVKPWGVDSNSGTNMPADPVRKDTARVLAFALAAKAAAPRS